MTGSPRIPWPDRETLIAWGFEPCRNPDCRILVNPAVDHGPYCSTCLRSWRKEKFDRRQRRREEVAA